ncbi:MAG: leucine-rich repeat domain-containing protein [Prevotellaceae bacterium]|nr:leucine-rich repeat domain-containing protein [Prevotellaceae bacterium]
MPSSNGKRHDCIRGVTMPLRVIPSSIDYEDANDSYYSGSYTVTSIHLGYNKDITSVTIPSSVKSIGSYAFEDCSGLTSVTSLSETPPSCSSNAFSNVDKSACTLIVPAGSEDAYASATGWSSFRKIREGA